MNEIRRRLDIVVQEEEDFTGRMGCAEVHCEDQAPPRGPQHPNHRRKSIKECDRLGAMLVGLVDDQQVGALIEEVDNRPDCLAQDLLPPLGWDDDRHGHVGIVLPNFLSI